MMMRLYSTATVALIVSPHLAGAAEHICHAEKTLVDGV
jgi:hypothetical protein